MYRQFGNKEVVENDFSGVRLWQTSDSQLASCGSLGYCDPGLRGRVWWQAMELIQKNKQKSEALGSELRHGSCKSLRRRRGIFGLFLAASASMSVIALYQLGILKRVPEPPLPRFASDNITGSARAYSLLATPDAVLAIGSYAATMTLAAMGSPDRANEQPLLPIALAAKVGFDAAVAAKYTLDEWRKHRSYCFWCLFASAATFAAVPLVIPEARSALRRFIA
jgi:hypothetical protein